MSASYHEQTQQITTMEGMLEVKKQNKKERYPCNRSWRPIGL
jgi:hypothetical protein